MASTAIALLKEILLRNRMSGVAIAGATALSWVIHFAERDNPPGRIPTTHDQVLGLLSFVVLFTTFGYVEGTGDRGMSRFPRRLFLLPVSTLQLVAVPIISGIIAVVLLYLLWADRLSEPGLGSRVFVAVLLGAFMVTYQTVLWTLERVGVLRLVVLGALGTVMFWIGFLPEMAAPNASSWKTKPVLGGVVAALAAVQFFVAWRYVARIRSEAERDESRLAALTARFRDALPRVRGDFRSAESAQIWFEWRCSGVGLPTIVAATLVLLVAPLSVMVRNEPRGTMELVMAVLALPLVLAVPVGLAFAKPMFWSEEIALVSFVALRPVSDAEMIAIKVKVAALATAIAWLLAFGFLAAWLPLWAHQPTARLLIVQLRAIDQNWWWAICALVLSSAMFVTWRFMVAGLWAGMSGSRSMFMIVIAPLGLAIVGSSFFDVAELPRWITADLQRLVPFLWVGTLMVAIKLAVAARGFRQISRPWARPYLAVWLGGVACLMGLSAVVMSKAGQSLSQGDANRVLAALILLAVLLMPLARIAWAPWFLGRNRHRG